MVEKTAKQIEFEKAAESLTAPDKEFVSTTEGGVPVTKAEEIISSNRAFQKKLTDPLLAPFQMIGNLVSPGQPFGQKNPYVATQEVQDARADELLNMKLHRENKEKVRGEVAALIKDVEDQYGDNPPVEVQRKLEQGVLGYINSAGFKSSDLRPVSPETLFNEDEFGLYTSQPNPYPIVEGAYEIAAGWTGANKGYNYGQKFAAKRWGEAMMRSGSRIKGPWWAKVIGAVLGGAGGVAAGDYGYETTLDLMNRAGKAKEFLKKGELEQLNLIDLGLAQLPESLTFGPKGINRPDEMTKIKSMAYDAAVDGAFSSMFFGLRPLYLGLKKVVGGKIFGIGEARPSKVAPGGREIIDAEQALLTSGKFDTLITKDLAEQTLQAPSEKYIAASALGTPPIPIPFATKVIERLARGKMFNFLTPFDVKAVKTYPRIIPQGPRTAVQRADVGGQTIRGLTKMLAKMPIFGGKAVKNKAEQLDFYFDLGESMIQKLTFAPLVNLTDHGIKIQNLSNTVARGFIDAAAEKQNALLEAARRYGAVVDDSGLVNEAKKIYERGLEQLQRVTTEGSNVARVPKQTPEEFFRFLKTQIIDPGVTGQRTISEYYGLRDQMDKLVAKFRKTADSEGTQDIMNIYRAWENDIGKLTDSGIPEVSKLWNNYEQFVSNGMLMFGTDAGKALAGKMERFGMALNFDPTKKSKDMFNSVLDIAKKDPANATTNLATMRNIVGDKAYYEGVGKYIGDLFSNSMVEKSGVTIFDANNFRKGLGLDKGNPLSNLFDKALPGPQVSKLIVRDEVTGVAKEFDRELFGEGLERVNTEFGKGITEIQKRQLPTKAEFEKFAKVFASAAQDGIPDISTFMARRAVMGGIRSGIASMLPGVAVMGGVGFSAGSWLIPAGLTWAMRHAGHVLTKPVDLANLRNMLDETLTVQLRLANMARLVRNYPEEWKEFDRELAELERGQAYREEVGKPMAGARSAGETLIDAAKDVGQRILDTSRTGTLGDPAVREAIPFINDPAPTFADEAMESFDSSSIGSSILQNPTMNPAAAASLYEGNLDQALANQVAPRMAAKGGIISLVS